MPSVDDEVVGESAAPGNCQREDPDLDTIPPSLDGKGDVVVGGTGDSSLGSTELPNDTKDMETPQLSSIPIDSQPADTKSEDSYPDSLQHDSNTSQDGEAVVDFQPDSGSVPNIPPSFSSNQNYEQSDDSLDTDDAVATRGEFDVLPERETAVGLVGDHSVSAEKMTKMCQEQFQENVHGDSVNHSDQSTNSHGEGEISNTGESSTTDHPGQDVKYKDDDSNIYGKSPGVALSNQYLW